MVDRLARWGGRGGLLALLVGVNGCNLQTPQLDALKRNLDVDPRERVRVYESCRSRSNSYADLNGCMETEGYEFVSVLAHQDYQATECWDDRDKGNIPKAYCWSKKSAPTTPKPATPAPRADAAPN